MSAPQDPWKAAIAAYERLTEYAEHRRGCSFGRTDFCDCGLHTLKPGALIDAARAADAARHQQEIERLNAKIRGLQVGEALSRHYHDSVWREFDLPDPSTNAIVDRLRVEIAKVATLRATVEQQAETIRQIQAQIATLTQERDIFESAATKALEARDADDARCATLTAALKGLRRVVVPTGTATVDEAIREADAALAAAPQGDTSCS